MSIEIVRPDTSLLIPTDEYNYGYEDKYHEGTFINDTTYIIPRFGSSPINAAVSCKIYRSGDFTLRYHTHEKDTLRMIENEIEIMDLPFYQFYHVLSANRNKEVYLETRYFNYLFTNDKSSRPHKRIKPGKTDFLYLNHHSPDDILFILTGLPVCHQVTVDTVFADLIDQDSI